MKYNESLGKQLYLLIKNKWNNIKTNSNIVVVVVFVPLLLKSQFLILFSYLLYYHDCIDDLPMNKKRFLLLMFKIIRSSNNGKQ